MRCIECGAELLGGRPLEAMKVQRADLQRTVIEYRCRQCAEELWMALWPDDYGPCPYYPLPSPGHA